MAKRKRMQNIEKMIKEGYGSGIGNDYKELEMILQCKERVQKLIIFFERTVF